MFLIFILKKDEFWVITQNWVMTKLLLIYLFSLYAASLGRERSPIELFVETHVQSQDRQKGAQQFVDNRAQHFMVCLFDHFILEVIM